MRRIYSVYANLNEHEDDDKGHQGILQLIVMPKAGKHKSSGFFSISNL